MKIGFSTYTPKQIDFLLNNFDFDLVQLPFNVFDNRLIQGGQLKALKKKKIEIHARSIFLQGLLLDFNNLSDYFLTWKNEFDITLTPEDTMEMMSVKLISLILKEKLE